MSVEPSMSQAVVFVLPNDVVHDVSQETCYHQDLHVITLPAVLKVSRDLCKGTETVIYILNKQIFINTKIWETQNSGEVPSPTQQ